MDEIKPSCYGKVAYVLHGFSPITRRHSSIAEAADEAVLNNVYKTASHNGGKNNSLH
jgi:hypothetical protein